MRDAVIGRLFRMTRFRRGWTQAELAMKAGLSPTVISRIEAGQASRYRLAVLQRHGDALGLRAEIGVMGRGGEAVRLLDEEHAAIVEYVATLLRHAGWSVDAEASFTTSAIEGESTCWHSIPGAGCC
jgi:transcriptional regulator with XRE-family HTH domain